MGRSLELRVDSMTRADCASSSIPHPWISKLSKLSTPTVSAVGEALFAPSAWKIAPSNRLGGCSQLSHCHAQAISTMAR